MECVTKEWVKELYNDTKEVWEQNRNEKDHSKGFAIFYSPPPYKINPTIAFIGINPGGDENDFDEQDCTIPPIENEYLKANYPLAQKIQKIFKAGDFGGLLKTV